MSRADVTTKSPIKPEGVGGHRDDPRKSGEIEMKVDGADRAPTPSEGFGGQGPYADPKSSKPGRPTIVDADIKPIRHTAHKTIVAVLEGGPFDGIEVDVDPMALDHKAVIERDPATIEPFEFDADAHALYVRSGGKEGRPNIVQGDHDTITYRRTNRKTGDGFVIFSAA